MFNGDASTGDDHETLVIEKKGSGFQFCKTAEKPYDVYVKAALLLANKVAPGVFELSCDGDRDPDCWTEGEKLATQAFT